MVQVLPTNWTSVEDPAFEAALEFTLQFHDSGFFKRKHDGSSLSIRLNPVYFGQMQRLSHVGLDGCEFRLEVDETVSVGHLNRAANAFDFMSLHLADQKIHFSFTDFSLLILVIVVGAVFWFITLGTGEEYWTLG